MKVYHFYVYQLTLFDRENDEKNVSNIHVQEIHEKLCILYHAIFKYFLLLLVNNAKLCQQQRKNKIIFFIYVCVLTLQKQYLYKSIQTRRKICNINNTRKKNIFFLNEIKNLSFQSIIIIVERTKKMYNISSAINSLTKRYFIIKYTIITCTSHRYHNIHIFCER